MLPVFAHSVWYWLWVCCKQLLLFWDTLLQYLVYWEFFSIKHCCILSKAFSASFEIIMWIFPLVLFMWWIMFIDLCVLNQPCIPGMKPTWLWWISFLILLFQLVCQYFIEDFYICVHNGYWPEIFFSCWVSAGFWYQDDVGLIKWFVKDSLFLDYLG